MQNYVQIGRMGDPTLRQGRRQFETSVFFSEKINNSTTGRFPFNLISITHDIKGFHVQICHRGSPGGEI